VEHRSAFPLDAASEAFEPFVGTWQTVGAHGLIPGVVLHGTTSFERLEFGGFLRLRSSILKDVGIPDGIAIIGGDGRSGSCAFLHHDERGVTRVYDAAVEDRTLRWWRDEPGLSQRHTLTASPDDATMVGKGELDRDGSTWEQDLDLTDTRVRGADRPRTAQAPWSRLGGP
jgi:hypothetical protein